MKPMKMWHLPATKTVQEAESDPTGRHQISGRICNTKHNGALALRKLNPHPSAIASSISSGENLNHSQHRACRRKSISCSSDAVGWRLPLSYRRVSVTAYRRFWKSSARSSRYADTPTRRHADTPTRRYVDTSLPISSISAFNAADRHPRRQINMTFAFAIAEGSLQTLTSFSARNA